MIKSDLLYNLIVIIYNNKNLIESYVKQMLRTYSYFGKQGLKWP